ncbi:chromosome condensation protein CrcB [[Haemophilus] ducreyi]|nr:CrcB family protein [[Haemophilus] ducreyi]AKO30231.1 chromosome condensation protein CrcB [[Haemophilus] ducreyi]AKO31664.1 chromosome condensation protein CrcB [[Haemophilus] ducreyi]AKO33115.1 chromosome condensation protein CrcB [[Haemophilus] ducreyi]AKO34565.1 chromosome condensation protein CrcB [[Haemophilus] ducreyi]AKO36000.1 chromosome condensation protein CrcB [[Haemophilus] ducreyi]
MNMLLVSLGAVAGAILRWQLAVWFNPFLTQFAFGTLFVNLCGCFLIGITLGVNLQDAQKLLFVTGFLGSFTTFSSFSAEVSQFILSEKYWRGLAVISAHLIGGLVLTILGILVAKFWVSGRFY